MVFYTHIVTPRLAPGCCRPAVFLNIYIFGHLLIGIGASINRYQRFAEVVPFPLTRGAINIILFGGQSTSIMPPPHGRPSNDSRPNLPILCFSRQVSLNMLPYVPAAFFGHGIATAWPALWPNRHCAAVGETRGSQSRVLGRALACRTLDLQQINSSSPPVVPSCFS